MGREKTPYCYGFGCQRSKFTALPAPVALGKVGLILFTQVSRGACNNIDWYRLLNLCSVTNTLIGDEGGLYYPGLFNERLKGTMTVAEMHEGYVRLSGSIRNKAARGIFLRGQSIGYI